MKSKSILILTILISILSMADAQTCGTNIFIDEFSTDGSLPSEWTEFNTSGQVTVDGAQLKFDYTADQPGAYRTFTPVSEEVTVSFDVESTRNWVKCRFDILSSDDKYVTSIMIGNDGVGNIQYATSLDASHSPTSFSGSLVDGSYAKNYTYTMAATIDFENKTIDFYEDGAKKAGAISFIETAGDIAKVRITQISMYSSEGRFFFDNIALAYPGADRSVLSAGINSAEDLTISAVISPLYGYSSESYEALKLAKEQSETILNNCDAIQVEIDAASANLQTAIADFENSFIDENVLTLYSSSSSQGDEISYRCGYYNGNLGDFEDKAVSFKLEKGYMLTVAQNVNGSGVSKVYVAADHSLELNFPAELQQSISFMRVGPWRDTKKRGSSGKSDNNDVVLALKSDWFYDWGSADVSMTECEYVIMDWSGGAGIDKMTTMGNNMAITHHLAFNEPDGENQANMTVDKAIEKYEILQASGLRLGAPAVTDGAKGRAWLDEFMPKAIAAGYRIDFIPVHYYKIMSAENFYNWLKDFYDQYQVPIWVTEWNYGDIWAANEKDKTEAQVLTNVQAYCEMMDNADFVERYCIFTWQPSQTSAQTVMSVRYPVTLNSVGEYYANHESPVAYIQENYENGPDLDTSNGINELMSEFSIYPNPVINGIIHLEISDEYYSEEYNISICDLSGNVLLNKVVKEKTIDVTGLSKGFYLIKLYSDNQITTRKILIE
ncbi:MULTISPECIES: glycosyl hydrolase [unclassified Saccharicrinis]|uniref:glycosyl hydrolase n=1 Tax=unclassified Saccharicrinis TaxID=2646859 RepID=UPI003D331083